MRVDHVKTHCIIAGTLEHLGWMPMGLLEPVPRDRGMTTYICCRWVKMHACVLSSPTGTGFETQFSKSLASVLGFIDVRKDG